MDDSDTSVTEARVDAQGMSRRAIIDLAKVRERKIVEKFEFMVAGYERALQQKQESMNGLTQLLGCIVERFGEMDFPLEAIGDMDPGRMYIVEHEGQWQVRIRDDASQPVELSLVPEFLPEEALDREKMERDGVTEVKLYDA